MSALEEGVVQNNLSAFQLSYQNINAWKSDKRWKPVKFQVCQVLFAGKLPAQVGRQRESQQTSECVSELASKQVSD